MQYPWLLSVALLLISLPSWANWQFVPEHSAVYAVSTKSLDIAEVHQFAIAHAKLTPQGKFSMAIALASVMSGAEESPDDLDKNHQIKVDAHLVM
ncbi:hypothetical protein [Shewanella sp.]|uniref:hypothetical protein n=1 Tax=Shewanella sp. TaxID=50422 RepID=UPI003A978426